MKEIIERFHRAATGPPGPAGSPKARRLGWLCAYTPEEMLGVDGLVPYRMRAPDCTGTDLADTYMGRVTCSYTRCILEAFEEDRFEPLDGFVFTTGCDHMRRLHDNLIYLRSPQFVHLLDVPHKNSEEAVAWYAEELKQLAEALGDAFGVKVDKPALRVAIGKWNRVRKWMTELDGLRAGSAPPLTGSEMVAVASGFSARPIEEASADLEELLGKARNAAGRTGHRARLLLVSSQLDDPRYVGALEATGGLLVGEIACTAATSYLGMVDEQAPVFEALARRYLKRVPCPRMMEEHPALLELILQMKKERRADGVILLCLKFCDIWGWENTLLVRELREAGVPVLRLEREYFLSGEGQIATRVQAFLESMGK